MFNIAICDDEIRFTGFFEQMLEKIAEESHICLDIDVFTSGIKLIKSLNENKKRYDIIFLDIEMKEMNGLDTARKIRIKDKLVTLIYVTSYKSYAIEAYEVQPFQFLVKPISYEILKKHLTKALERINHDFLYYEYKYKRDYYKVLINDIIYFESNKRVVLIHMRNKEIYRYYDKLNDIEMKLKKDKIRFWRIHQSYLINSKHIIRKSYNQIFLSDGSLLYISEDRRKDIDELYCESIEGDIIE